MNNRTLWLAGVAAFVGCAIGYFAAGDSAQTKKLQNEVTKLQSELDQASRSNFSASKPRARSVSSPRILQTTTNNTPDPGTPQPMSPEWQAQMQAEVKRRSNERGVARTASARSAEYTRIFSELQVSPENTERFKAMNQATHGTLFS